jgi:hypothetical protein
VTCSTGAAGWLTTIPSILCCVLPCAAATTGTEPPGAYLELLAAEGAVAVLLHACEVLDTSELLPPVGLAHRLVTSGSPALAQQYLQVRGRGGRGRGGDSW